MLTLSFFHIFTESAIHLMELNFLGKYIGKDDVVANYVKKCKLNEQIYENTIKKLQENNMRLMDELAQFKED